VDGTFGADDRFFSHARAKSAVHGQKFMVDNEPALRFAVEGKEEDFGSFAIFNSLRENYQ